jgi:hypothetical protein
MKLRLLLSALFCAMLVTGFSQITSVGLIGSATPNGWEDPDTDMVQDAVDPNVWTLNITLTAGAVKFRADDSWDVNWGSLDFPCGVGTQGGDDIPVFAGEYDITFNSETGEYCLDVISPIGLVGDATPGGWDNDTKMYKDTTDHGFFVEVDLVAGNAKFRKDGQWTVNWGAEDWPSGIGTQGGPDIPVPTSGTYRVTLDTMSGAYLFEELVAINSIGLVGDATPGGWDVDTELMQDANDGAIWRANIELVPGNCKFRANGEWMLSWGSPDWPTGIGTASGGDIPVPEAGTFQVTLNTTTGEYSFLPVVYYETIGIIGDATPGGWGEDTDLEMNPEDSAQWSLRVELTDGLAKFRANNVWTDANWGGSDFPSGIGVQDGPDIPVEAGEYFIDFNTTTGAYNFSVIIAYDTVGIVGEASPSGSWDIDTDLIKDPDNELHFFLNSITMADGPFKFRANHDWTVNWGAEAWPTGTGTQDGPNITSVAGEYSVSIFTDTGDYAFADPVSTKEELLQPTQVSIFPNPVGETLNVDLSKLDLRGDVTLTVMDINGKQLLTKVIAPNDILNVDISGLQNGNYILHITSPGYIVGKRFSIVK